VENSRGARKLARTPHVNQKKKRIFKKKMVSYGNFSSTSTAAFGNAFKKHF
jgi:hypothetical protein